jgi:hypothetical protein
MPPELDNQDPELDAPEMGAEDPAMGEPDAEPEMAEPTGDSEVIGLHGDEGDREGAMAKADLFKLANYSHKLYQQLNDEDQLESWVQAKITKAADYIASVYHYLEYEMKFSEYGHHLDNSDTLSESQKRALKNRLMEAKMRIKELKQAQAEKVTIAEGILRGGEHECAECGGTGIVHMPGIEPSEKAKRLAKKHDTSTRAHFAAMKRLQAEGDDEMEEGFEAGAKAGSEFKTKTGVATKTPTGLKHTNTSHSDEEHGEPPSKVKARSAADKAGEKAQDKADEKESKAWGKANPGKQHIYKDGKKVNEAKLKGKQTKLDVDKDGDIEADDLADLRAGKKAKKVSEAAKPSAGLSKEKKSAVVKKAKAGGDIGKPGKSFDKVAKAAGGGKKGEKIAAAAMWKNIKETTAYLAEKKKKEKMTDENLTVVPNPSGAKDAEEAKKLGAAMPKPAGSAKDPISESARLRELTGRLNRAERPALVENREVDQIRALTQRLLG